MAATPVPEAVMPMASPLRLRNHSMMSMDSGTMPASV